LQGDEWPKIRTEGKSPAKKTQEEKSKAGRGYTLRSKKKGGFSKAGERSYQEGKNPRESSRVKNWEIKLQKKAVEKKM